MRIVIFLPDASSEAFLSLHAVRQLMDYVDSSQITIACPPKLMPLVRSLAWDVDLVAPEAVHHQFELGVDLSQRGQHAWKLFRRGIRRRLGFSQWGLNCFLTDVWPKPTRKDLSSPAELYWQLLRLIHPSLQPLALEARLRSGDFRSPQSVADAAEKVLLVPSAKDSFQRWDSLARSAKAFGEPHFVLSPELEQNAFEEQLRSLGTYKLTRLEDELDALQFLGTARYYVGPSGFLAHVAGVSARKLCLLTSLSTDRRTEAPFASELQHYDIASELPAAEQLFEESAPVADRSPLSAFVICKNEEANIERCLRSLSWCDEVLVVDSGSTDNTLEIAEEYATRIISRSWPGHRLQKQFALGECSHEWVLNIDADEEVSPELRRQILDVLERDCLGGVRENGFEICRVVRFLHQWWYRGGWHPEYRLRFMRKAFASWGGIDPHEKALVRGKVGRLDSFLYHFSFSNLSEQDSTTNAFTSLMAEKLHERGKRFFLVRLVVNPIARFVKFFFFKRGYRFGVRGFIVAVGEAYQCFLKHAKLWELEQGKASEITLKRDPQSVSGKIVPLSSRGHRARDSRKRL